MNCNTTHYRANSSSVPGDPTPIPFNLLKANTKWVEYTAIGIAVLASRGTVYDDCCADGCGMLAETRDQWLAALESLTRDPAARAAMVEQAQRKLSEQYSVASLRGQVWSMLHGAGLEAQPMAAAPLKLARPQERVMFVSNSYVPTLQLSFVKPLAPLVEAGIVAIDFLSEEQIKQKLWETQGAPSPQAWIARRLQQFKPSLLVFCRYSGPYVDDMLAAARALDIPVIYHIDDDLLGIPKDIGASKHRYHNDDRRLATVRRLLDEADLVYASTAKLKKHLEGLACRAPILAGKIYCSGTVINPAARRPVVKIGYMASADHVHNLTEVKGALVRLLRKNPAVRFEFFGSISAPPEFAEFGDRISHAPKIDNYEQFLQCFAKFNWDIGICPLTSIHFNLMKADTKWVEYSSVGAAVIASRGTTYDACCSDGAGQLAANEDQWFEALDRLTADPEARYRQVLRAQEKLASTYSVERLRQQVLDMFEQAHLLRVARKRAVC